MSRALLIRSIPLSAATRNAWKEAGAHFIKRGSSVERAYEVAGGDRPIINLGNSRMQGDMWNSADDVMSLLKPRYTRHAMGTLMPTDMWGDTPAYYWLKAQGRAGMGKEKVWVESREQYADLRERARWIGADIQVHIEGTEYRVITVGHKVVQVSVRHGQNGDRSYEWVGVVNAPTRVKDTARNAARMLPSDKTIIGWDIIQWSMHTPAFLLEGNACPGVNSATAGRILDAVEGVQYEGR